MTDDRHYIFIRNTLQEWANASPLKQATIFTQLFSPDLQEKIYYSDRDIALLKAPNLSETPLGRNTRPLYLSATKKDLPANISSYEINRVILQSLCQPINEWSKAFTLLLSQVCTLLETRSLSGNINHKNQSHTHHYNQNIIRQCKYLISLRQDLLLNKPLDIKQKSIYLLGPGLLSDDTLAQAISYLFKSPAVSFVAVEAILAKMLDKNGLYFEDKITLLHKAIRLDHSTLVTYLIEAGINPLMADLAYKNTPWHLAIRYETMNLFQTLKNTYLDGINEKNALGDTPLIMAFQYDQLEAFKALLEMGANSLMTTIDGNNLWHLAVQKNKLKNLQAFISLLSPNWDDKNNAGQTALMIACENGELDSVRILLEMGANASIGTNDGNNAWHWAACYNWVDVLIKLHKIAPDFNKQNNAGQTALMIACENGELDSVRILLEMGANASIGTNDGNNAWHWAARYNWVDILTKLHKVAPDFDKQNNAGQTPLMIASRYNRSEAIMRLIELGADVSISNPLGNNLWHFVAFDNKLRAFHMLKKNCLPGFDLANKKGETPLMIAWNERRLEIVKGLLEMGASLLINNHNENTLWHEAAQNNCVDVLLVLERVDPEGINKKNSMGQTPLMLAVEADSSDATDMLGKMLEARASIQSERSPALIPADAVLSASSSCFFEPLSSDETVPDNEDDLRCSNTN